MTLGERLQEAWDADRGQVLRLEVDRLRTHRRLLRRENARLLWDQQELRDRIDRAEKTIEAQEGIIAVLMLFLFLREIVPL